MHNKVYCTEKIRILWQSHYDVKHILRLKRNYLTSEVWSWPDASITETTEIGGHSMGLLPDTQNCGCACAGNAGNVFPATAGKRSRHASRHVRHARAVMHAGIANLRFPSKSAVGENVPGIPGACANSNFTYLVWGPWVSNYIHVKQWDAITYPCHKVYGGLMKPPLNIGHGRVITYHLNCGCNYLSLS